VKKIIFIASCFALAHFASNNAMDTPESSTDERSCSSEGACTGGSMQVLSQEEQDLDKQLRDAIKRGDIQALSLFLAHGGSVEGINKPNKRSLLIHASKNGQPEICKLLINAQANVNAADIYGGTPLACASNDQIYKILIEAGANVNAKDIYGDTALFQFKSNEQCRLLLQAGAATSIRNSIGETALFRCALLLSIGEREQIMGEKEILEQCQLLLEAGTCVNAQNNEGETVLQQYFDHSNLRRLLLAHHADVNSQDNKGITVLMRASRSSKNFDIAKELITKYNADMHIQNARGYSALLIAAAWKQIETCRLFTEHQMQLDLGIIVALGCIKKKCKDSLYARSLYHNRKDLLIPFIRPYLKTHSLKALLNAQNNKGLTAYDLLEPRDDFLKPIGYQDSHDDEIPEMSPDLDLFYDGLSSASPQSLSDDQENSSGGGSFGSEGNLGYEGE